MNLHPKLLELLNKRGLSTKTEIEEFLSAKPQKTYDPFLLLNMEAGVDLILSAIEEDENICIYGDYDADGITSATLLMEVLSYLTDRLSYYIPSRFEEGYGLNCDALDRIRASGVNLVITVDCGSVSFAEVEHAKEIGLKILVTDHHTVPERTVDCLVINPMQPGCPYPFKYLAGVGVAFKLAQAIAAETGLPKQVINRTLDLVGVGTIGDIVPLTDENRTLAKYGIRAINLTQRPGLSGLIEGVKLHPGGISSENISYIIVPHLNAAGRMKNATIAADLLMEHDWQAVSDKVSVLISCNDERKRLQSETFEECRKIVEEKYRDDLFYVIDLPDAHEGITGIVAGKLKETYHRPAVIVTSTADGCLKGTGRGIEGISLYSFLKENENLFERFGGHAAACGFTMKKENLKTLRENLNRAMAEATVAQPDLLIAAQEADLELSADDVTMALVSDLRKLEPFGCANPQPVIGVRAIPSAVRKLGNRQQFRKFTGILENGREVQCVIFRNGTEYDNLLQAGRPVHITGTLQSQSWNGRSYLQITVLGMEI